MSGNQMAHPLKLIEVLTVLLMIVEQLNASGASRLFRKKSLRTFFNIPVELSMAHYKLFCFVVQDEISIYNDP